jgi:uncharacterized membrane protein
VKLVIQVLCIFVGLVLLPTNIATYVCSTILILFGIGVIKIN